MPDTLDPAALLRYLYEQGVEHIVIGSFAITAHGLMRMTKDLDTVPRATEKNLTRLSDALRDLEATTLDSGDFEPQELPMDPIRPTDLAQGGNFYLDTRLGRLDIMQWVGGIEADDLYAELDRAAITGDIDGVPVRVCGLEHLCAMKHATGRPLDLEDIERLKRRMNPHTPYPSSARSMSASPTGPSRTMSHRPVRS